MAAGVVLVREDLLLYMMSRRKWSRLWEAARPLLLSQMQVGCDRGFGFWVFFVLVAA